MASRTTIWIMLTAFFATAWSAAQAAERPNILFAIADDASYPHMSAYGCQWVNSPGFDYVAEQGLLFNNAYTPNAKCAPSRACILTGRNSWQLEHAGNHMAIFPPKFKTYVEVLADNGYHTGKVLKGWAPGIAETAEGDRRFPAGKPFNNQKAKPPATGITNNDYAANFQEFLDAKPDETPFCFWYGCVEPHRGYEYGAGVAKGGKSIDQIDKVPAFWPDNETTRNDMLDYAFEIEHFDTHLVRMLAILKEKQLLHNTIVVVTADNGMPFPRCKGQEYEYSNHLPLAIMWQSGIAHSGRVIDDYVSFIDFAPTFLEAAGVDPKTSGMAEITGKSLRPIFLSDEAGQVVAERDHVLIGKERHDTGRPDDGGYPIRGIVKNGMLYLHNFETDRWPAGDPITGYLNVDGSPTKTEILNLRRSGTDVRYWQQSFGKRQQEELYNIRTDPECLNNLIDLPGHAEQQSELRQQLISELSEQQDPRMAGNGKVFDEYPYSDQRTQQFYNRFTKGEKLNAGWVNETDFEKEPVD